MYVCALSIEYPTNMQKRKNKREHTRHNPQLSLPLSVGFVEGGKSVRESSLEFKYTFIYLTGKRCCWLMLVEYMLGRVCVVTIILLMLLAIYKSEHVFGLCVCVCVDCWCVCVCVQSISRARARRL